MTRGRKTPRLGKEGGNGSGPIPPARPSSAQQPLFVFLRRLRRMGLRSIWRTEKNVPAPTTRQRLNRDAISALFWVILTSLMGIIVLSGIGLLLRFGLFGASPEAGQSFADEALSILGNIGSAAIGGLVGWLTRDQLSEKDTGFQQLPPEPTEEEVAMPLRIEDTSTYSTGIPVVTVEETDENLTNPDDVSKKSKKPNTSEEDDDEA